MPAVIYPLIHFFGGEISYIWKDCYEGPSRGEDVEIERERERDGTGKRPTRFIHV